MLSIFPFLYTSIIENFINTSFLKKDGVLLFHASLSAVVQLKLTGSLKFLGSNDLPN